jgi:hypothetical protein
MNLNQQSAVIGQWRLAQALYANPTKVASRRVTAHLHHLRIKTAILFHSSAPPFHTVPHRLQSVFRALFPLLPLGLHLRPFQAMSEPSNDTTANNATISSPPAKRVKTSTDDQNQNGDATMSDGPATTSLATQPPLLIKKLSDKGRAPTRGSAFAAGYDLYAARDTTVPARGKVLVDTDIAIAVPEGTCKLLPAQEPHVSG